MPHTRHDQPTTGTRPCIADTHCKGYDRLERRPAWTATTHPYCDPCIAAATRDIRMLACDWYDLAQQQYPTLSQAPSTSSAHRQRPEPPIPLREGPDALQREIHHAVTTWEAVVREHARLSTPADLARHGPAVQRAVGILAPRVRLLAQLPATTVYPTGCEDQPTDMTGADAIDHLCRLRARARSMLGWTHRRRWVPGDCWACDGRDADDLDGPLYRSEPRYEPGTWDGVLTSRVHCDRCGQDRPEADYDEYLVTLRWPGQPDEQDTQPTEPTTATP
ncbi:hypothetical protein [Verrucosispora sp. WMMC514]|uniref:hypothetical protein n=1 Tax=Verrucosispora sp. WMMC514 TaxID=3015156 RepID=UPI00248B0383|nr:hypothetical protein [Verrucosispora sp. WMMC514]WBB94208.1 hypothetical protein O7597_15265 [Verrucosispora sp. WMMC514]